VFVIALANRFSAVMEIGFSGNRYPDKLDQSVWDHLSLERDIVVEIVDEVNREIEKAKVFLRLD
jgi:hypothetical protein